MTPWFSWAFKSSHTNINILSWNAILFICTHTITQTKETEMLLWVCNLNAFHLPLLTAIDATVLHRFNTLCKPSNVSIHELPDLIHLWKPEDQLRPLNYNRISFPPTWHESEIYMTPNSFAVCCQKMDDSTRHEKIHFLSLIQNKNVLCKDESSIKDMLEKFFLLAPWVHLLSLIVNIFPLQLLQN